MIVESPPAVPALVITGAFSPTLKKSETQTLVSLTDARGQQYRVTLTADGLCLAAGSDHLSTSVLQAPIGQWRAFLLYLDLERGIFRFSTRSAHFTPMDSEQTVVLSFTPAPGVASGRITFAAREAVQSNRQWIVGEAFNGRLADLALFTGSGDIEAVVTSWTRRDRHGASPQAAWDFVAQAASENVPDVVEGISPGRTINRPTRLVAGPQFAGQSLRATETPELFNAAHFHDDDLADAGWSESFDFVVPEDLPSGVYGFYLQTDGGEDKIPFFVTARPGEERAAVAILMPTLSYQVYANISTHLDMLSSFGTEFTPFLNTALPETPEEAYARENRLLSCYDLHSDGSGVSMVTMLRPLVINVRPGAIFRLNDSPHEFNSDMCLVDWLHAKNIPYEVLTDHDLHARGPTALKPYRAVISGTHTEYWSSAMLDGLKAYTDDGGRFLCLSGNALYWATDLSADGTLCELRRDNGVRTWTYPPYEIQLSLSGRRGGLWRDHGRAAQRYVGTGFIAQGADVGKPYVRRPESESPRAAFIFEGVSDRLIGDVPSLVSRHGAAGMEFDRADARLGTPEHALILARASGFSDAYQVSVEEVPMTVPIYGGTQSPDCYSDMVYYETPKGGAVFSAPSMSWSACLSYNDYENSVSRVTENVVRAFMSAEWWPHQRPPIE